MRVLLASTAGAGHLNPVIPFARALRRAGHEILVAAPISAQPRVERAGLPSISFADPLERDLAPVRERLRAATPDEANDIVIGETFGRVRSRAALPGIELAMDAWRPHVVLRDSCEFASAVAAEARDLPVARIGPWLLTMEDLAVRIAAPAVDELRWWAGVEPDPEGARLAASPYLTLTPPAVELPGGPEQEAVLRFHAAPPPLRAVRPAGAPPLVYLTFGSVAASLGFFPGLYRDVIDALADLPIRLLVTVGEAADPAALGPLPAHVRAERWIPQAEVFTEADAMIGHGGFGTTMGALLAGVPQVVVPLFADQPYNAQRIAALGAGLAARSDDLASVRAAVERVLAEPAFRVAAGRVALDAQALLAIDQAPAAIEALVAGAPEASAALIHDRAAAGGAVDVRGWSAQLTTLWGMTETAIFAAGCFWGVEAEFRRADGVTATRVGYTGGHTDHPTYRQVCGKRTGHAEAVEVTFDPAVLSYDELLARFWAVHDPTTRNRQGFDIGSQYRSAIFFSTPEQEQAATSSRDAQQAALEEDGGRGLLGRRRRVVTEITPATTFWPAEDDHQRYLEKRGRATCAAALRDSA